MKRRNLSAADRDRIEEEESERYNTLFEHHQARLIREYRETGGDDEWLPRFATVHAIVQKIMDREAREADEHYAEGRTSFGE